MFALPDVFGQVDFARPLAVSGGESAVEEVVVADVEPGPGLGRFDGLGEVRSTAHRTVQLAQFGSRRSRAVDPATAGVAVGRTPSLLAGFGLDA